MLRSCATVFILICAALGAQAQELPAPLSPFVSDYAGLLPAADEAALTEELRKLRRAQGIEMAVVVMGSRSDYGSTESLEAFATRLFDTWGIGDAQRNDGILFLVLKYDRLTRIELGQAYATSWDGTAARILDRHVLPAFSQDDYAQGIKAGTRETIATLAMPYAEGAAPQLRSERLSGWIVAGLAALAGLFAFRRRISDKAQTFRRCPNCGRRMLQVTRETTLEPSKTSAGQAIRRITCGICDYDNAEVYTLSRRTSSSGRSGFGGGRSGGGGASGGW